MRKMIAMGALALAALSTSAMADSTQDWLDANGLGANQTGNELGGAANIGNAEGFKPGQTFTGDDRDLTNGPITGESSPAVPTPAGAVVLGLGALAAGRRRRQA